MQEVYKQSEKKYADLIPYAEALESAIPQEALSHYRYAYIFKLHIMRNATRAALCTSKMSMGEEVEKNRAESLYCLEDLLARRKEFDQGKWEKWFDCDERRRIRELICDIKQYQYAN